MTPAQPTHLQLFAALAAMSEANLALRAGAAAAPAFCRAARCLDVLADCPDLAPSLRRLCGTLSEQWAAAIAGPAIDRSLHGAGSAAVIPAGRRADAAVHRLHL